MHGTWSWVLMAGLGAYHGLNPAMGWLFAVGLGLQDRDRRSVLRALPPIALGHELSIAVVATIVLGLGLLTDPSALHLGAGIALVAFGIFRFWKPRAHFRWTKGKVNRRELAWWSFLMSSAHGAGLMVAPVLLGAGTAAADAKTHGLEHVQAGLTSVPAAAAGIALHVGAMLLVMGIVAVLVYDKLGLRVLRKAWINTDHVWAAAFVWAGAITLVS
jgi:hypothetical protein